VVYFVVLSAVIDPRLRSVKAIFTQEYLNFSVFYRIWNTDRKKPS